MSIRDLVPTFEAALEHCGQGYDDDRQFASSPTRPSHPANPQEAARAQVIKAILATAIAAASSSGKPLRVLD